MLDALQKHLFQSLFILFLYILQLGCSFMDLGMLVAQPSLIGKTCLYQHFGKTTKDY